MKFPARTVLIALVVVGAGVILWSARGGASGPPVTYPKYDRPPAETAEALKNRPVGMSGCLASACHGGPAENTLEGKIGPSTWQGSGTCWAAVDPHAAAYSLLTDKPYRAVNVTAAQIMARYEPGKLATEEARCVACHTNPALARPELMNDPHARRLRTEGVSCEACHGNAGAWVSEHTAWKGDRRAVYEKFGMTPLFDTGDRAMNCMGCHVGAPADGDRQLPVRDMNHDMIAAGHPRLNFDFAEYLRRLPPHWQEKDRTKEKETSRTLNAAQVWYVGRVAHAEAACKLLADRAERSRGDAKSPWPEFAEFDCAACHHNLRIDDPGANWRQSPAYLGGRPPGAAPWQTIWPVGYAPGLALPKRQNSPLTAVVDMMEVPRPAKAEAAKGAALTTASELHQLRVKLMAQTGVEVERQARAFFPDNAPLVPDWDSATQLFFGLAALERTGKPDDATLAGYRQGVSAFRKRDWPGFEQALEAIRKKK